MQQFEERAGRTAAAVRPQPEGASGAGAAAAALQDGASETGFKDTGEMTKVRVTQQPDGMGSRPCPEGASVHVAGQVSKSRRLVGLPAACVAGVGLLLSAASAECVCMLASMLAVL